MFAEDAAASKSAAAIASIWGIGQNVLNVNAQPKAPKPITIMSATAVRRQQYSSSSSRTRLRQIALVAEDLEKARHLLTNVLGTEVVFVDPQVAAWGLENFLVAIGGDIIEVVSPTKPNTAAGRLLSKRGDGGYMIIMQTSDAMQQRAYIESKGLATVIYSHELDGGVCVQYHPKGIKGGIIPELDSHRPTSAHPDPVAERFSPWPPCGANYAAYSAAMRRTAHLHLIGAVCRLAPGEHDPAAASRQWREIFGIPLTRERLAFTNANLAFVRGAAGAKEGLISITIAVQGGMKRICTILDRAKLAGIPFDGDAAWVDMVGVRWYFVPAGAREVMSNL